jgi:hypothetical protein
LTTVYNLRDAKNKIKYPKNEELNIQVWLSFDTNSLRNKVSLVGWPKVWKEGNFEGGRNAALYLYILSCCISK